MGRNSNFAGDSFGQGSGHVDVARGHRNFHLLHSVGGGAGECVMVRVVVP